jgi:hypothetical protein
MTTDSRNPPRFVPTLTDKIGHEVSDAPDTDTAQSQPIETRIDEQLMVRIMQRVDLALERRLREAIASVIAEHTQSMVPQLHDQISIAIESTVRDAVAQELGRR